MATLNFGAGETNYTGEVLEDLLTYVAQENETYKEGLVHHRAGIQKKLALPHVRLKNIIQDHVPTPTSSQGEFIFGERYLEPEDFIVYFEFNPRNYEKYYKPFQPNGKLLFRQLDPKVQAKMLRLLMEGKDEYIDQSIWCSATPAEKAKISGTTDLGSTNDYGPMKYFNGALMRMLMNAAATAGSEEERSGQITVAGTGTFADGEAVEKELNAMWAVTPPKIRKKKDLTIVIDYKSWDAYDKYLASKDFKYNDNREENQRRFKGKRIVPLTALPDDTIVFGCFSTTENSNLWMGVDIADDENCVQVDKLQNNSELYFCKMILKMDVNIVRPAEIVAHLPFVYGASAPAPSNP